VWQIHEVIYANEPSLYFRPGGAVEALDEAKRSGKVRFVGFTGHKDPAIHLEMLSHKFPFDTCQLPLNCFDAGFRSFEQRVLPELHRQRITPIGMKSLGGEGIPIKKRAVKVADALRYAMSLPVGTTVSGIDSLKVLRQNLRIATNFQPLSDEEMQALRQQTAEAAADGHFELYKTSMKNDGAEGRRVHGFPSEKEMSA
jgi:predicted aldo/keto reductase-like oxidoreductase